MAGERAVTGSSRRHAVSMELPKRVSCFVRGHSFAFVPSTSEACCLNTTPPGVTQAGSLLRSGAFVPGTSEACCLNMTPPGVTQAGTCISCFVRGHSFPAHRRHAASIRPHRGLPKRVACFVRGHSFPAHRRHAASI